MAERARWKKILIWTGIGLGTVILGFGIWLWALYSGSDSEYTDNLETLLPDNALVMTRIDNFRSTFEDLDANLEHHFSEGSFRKLEDAPFIRQLLSGDNPDVLPPTITNLREEQIHPALQNAEQQVSNLPLGLDLYEDLIGKELLLAVYGDRKSGMLTPVFLTRVSQTVQFYWNFKGWSEGKQGNANITIDGDIITVDTGEEGKTPLVITLLDDVLVSTRDRKRLDAIVALHGKSGNHAPITKLPLYDDVKNALETDPDDDIGAVKLIANLNAIRDYQGPDETDPEKRAALDQVFSLPYAMLQASQEIMPTVNAALKNAIDMKAFSIAGWNIALHEHNRIEIDQYLFTDARKMKNLDGLEKSWRAKPAPMDFLGFLPNDTWMVSSVLQPYDVLKDAIKPETREGRDGTPDTVATFMLALGDNPPIDGYGLAFLSQRFALSETPDMVSRLDLPPFAIFIHWPGLTLDVVHQVMNEQLRKQGADKSMSIVRQSAATGDQFLIINNQSKTETSKWLSNQLAIGVIGDYFVFTMSREKSAMEELFLLAKKGGGESLLSSREGPWALLPKNHTALMHIGMTGLNAYNRRVGLSKELAGFKFHPDRPFGKDLKEWRIEFEKELGVAPGTEDQRVEKKFADLKNRWRDQSTPWQRDMERTLGDISTAMSDFTAVTDATPERMHTKFMIRGR